MVRLFVAVDLPPEIRERLLAQGAEPRAMTPHQFGEFLGAETAKWRALAKATGIKLE